MNEKFKSSKEAEFEAVEATKGEEFLRGFGEFPEDYHFSAEQKLLFSTVTKDEDKTDAEITKSKTATFTALGLEYAGRRYPYNDNAKAIAHKGIIYHFLEGLSSPEAARNKFEKVNEFWEQPLYEHYLEKIRGDIHKSITEELDRKKYEKDRAYAKIPKECRLVTNDDAIQYEIEHGFLSAEVGQEMLDYNSNLEKLLKRLDERVINETLPSHVKDYQRQLSNSPMREPKTTPEERAKGNANSVRKTLKDCLLRLGVNEIEKQPVKEDTMINDLGLKSTQTSVHEYRRTYEKTKNELSKKLEKINLANDPEIEAIVKKAESLARNYYGKAYPEHFKARNEIRAPYHEAAKEYEKAKSSQNDDLEKANQEALKLAESKITEFKKRALEMIFHRSSEEPLDISKEDIYFFPTGAVCRTTEGRFQASTFSSPLSEDILSLFDEDYAKRIWRVEWKKNMRLFNEPALQAIATNCKDEAASCRDDFDERIAAFAKNHQVILPKTFDPTTGKVFETLQERDFELLDYTMSKVGDFIDGVNLSQPSTEISLKSVRLEIIDFLSGRKELKNSSLFQGDRSLKIRALESLIDNSEPEKADKVGARLVPELGIAVYNSLKEQQQEAFSKIIGARANVSQSSFYNVYRTRIFNDAERRTLSERTFFLLEFSHYLEGKTSPELTAFFDSLKKQTVLDSDSGDNSTA